MRAKRLHSEKPRDIPRDHTEGDPFCAPDNFISVTADDHAHFGYFRVEHGT